MTAPETWLHRLANLNVARTERRGLAPHKPQLLLAIMDMIEDYKKSLAKGRSARFRSDVLTGYRFTCTLTGYRINTDGEHLVEAAHIHRHSESGDNDPRNGLALTPDAHWMFDRGLWTVDYREGAYLVRVAAGKFEDESPVGRSLMQHNSGSLYLAGTQGLRPDPKRLAWHRISVFLG